MNIENKIKEIIDCTQTMIHAVELNEFVAFDMLVDEREDLISAVVSEAIPKSELTQEIKSLLNEFSMLDSKLTSKIQNYMDYLTNEISESKIKNANERFVNSAHKSYMSLQEEY